MIPKSLEDLKSKIMKRQELYSELKTLKEKIVSGASFFASQADNPSAPKLRDGSKTLLKYVKRIEEITVEMFELDTIIVTRLESEFLDSLIEIRTRDMSNDAGDAVGERSFFFVPDAYKPEDMIAIDENDLWFLKIIKAAFAVRNVDISKKEEV